MANPDVAKLETIAREGRVQILRMLTHAISISIACASIRPGRSGRTAIGSSSRRGTAFPPSTTAWRGPASSRWTG